MLLLFCIHLCMLKKGHGDVHRVEVDQLVLTSITLIIFSHTSISNIFYSSEKRVYMNPYRREHSWMVNTQMPWCTDKSWAIQKMSRTLQVHRVKETHALLNMASYKATVLNLPSQKWPTSIFFLIISICCQTDSRWMEETKNIYYVTNCTTIRNRILISPKWYLWTLQHGLLNMDCLR